MKSFSTSPPTKRNLCCYRFLKPGALAQLRNSKISARSNKPNSPTWFPTHRVDSPRIATPQIPMINELPSCLLTQIYGPKCLKRKKLMASRSVLLFNSGPSTPGLESGTNNDSLINVLNNDVVVAH